MTNAERKLTPKQSVLREFPNAYAYYGGLHWYVDSESDKVGKRLGSGSSEDEAWADAARNLRGKK